MKKTSKYFKQDPIISWQKIMCDLCGEPTGPKSECYNKAPEELKDHQKKIYDKRTGIMAVYSTNCVFRKENIWEATFNYFVSVPLLERLRSIKGLERILPIKPYTIRISINNIFQEKDVKQEINLVFTTFIKELQSIESGTIEDEILDVKTNYVGVLFPNGREWRPDNPVMDQFLMETVLDSIPDTKGILESL